MADITPTYPTIPMKEKVFLLETPEFFGQTLGGIKANATSIQQGSGDDIFKVDYRGMWLGAADFADAKFSVSMAGAISGISLAVSQLDIPNTTSAASFHVDNLGNMWSGDTALATAPFSVTNAGIVVATDITITGGTIDGTTTLGGRTASVLATAIDASGHFADDAINTATSTILDSFTFSGSGAIQIGTFSAGVTGDIKISPAGILGRDKDNNTTFSINATTGVAVLNGLVVGTNVGLGTAQDSSGVTTIIGSTVTTGFVNALDVNALTVSASISITTPTITGGTIQTNSGATAGIKMDSTSLRGYDNSNNVTFELVRATGVVTMRGATILQQFTAGENLNAEDLVTTGHVEAKEFVGPTYVPHDSYTQSALPDNNQGSSTTMEIAKAIGVDTKYGFIKILTGDPSYPRQFNRVFLRLRLLSGTNRLIEIRRVTSSWTEGAITWNNSPSVETSSAKFRISITTPSSPSYFDIDITSLYCAWDSGELTNYGIRIGMVFDSTSVVLTTSEAGDASIVKIRGLTDTDKVYKAENTYPLHLFATIGFVNETVTSGNTADINVSPVIEGLTGLTAGSAYYIGDTAGGISASPNGLSNILRIGFAIDSTTLRFEKGAQTITRTRMWRRGSAHQGDNAPEGSGSPELSGGNDLDAICLGVPIRELRIEAFAHGSSYRAESKGTFEIAAVEGCIFRRTVAASSSDNIGRSTVYIVNLIGATSTVTVDIKHVGASYIVMDWAGLGSGVNDYDNVFLIYTAVI